MQYIVLDLEWNGAFSHRAHGYFNEIIEIGATRMSPAGEPLDGFEILIRPVVSRKLTSLVTDLTGIEQKELRGGVSFAEAVRRLQEWIGEPEALLLTWSTTDLLVLLENCRYFLDTERIPFMTQYADAQAYAQSRMELENPGRQIGLSKAAELLGISLCGMDMHRAEDDSRLTACILQRVWDAKSFAGRVKTADEEFYARLTFKNRIVSAEDDPLVKREYLQFSCPSCGKPLRAKSRFRFFGHMLCADMVCNSCRQAYTARVQVKEKYEGVTVKKRLTPKKPPEANTKEEAEHE